MMGGGRGFRFLVKACVWWIAVLGKSEWESEGVLGEGLGENGLLEESSSEEKS